MRICISITTIKELILYLSMILLSIIYLSITITLIYYVTIKHFFNAIEVVQLPIYYKIIHWHTSKH
jgi:hypothetical protein